HLGLLTPVNDQGKPKAADTPLRAAHRLLDPYNAEGDLAERARSYLHVNCAHCHQAGAGGTARIDLRFDLPLKRTNALGVPPVQGDFALAEASLLAPGDPYRSVIWYRLAKLGSGRMPHIGSDVIDGQGLSLLHDWIAKLPDPAGGKPRRAEEEELVERFC